MPSVDTPPLGGPDERSEDPSGRVVSPSALAMARLLRLRPRRGPRPSGQQVRDALEIPRWAMLLTIILTLLLFLSLLVLFFPAESKAAVDSVNFDKPTKDWYGGPVRYIITKQEVKAYKALETELDRQNFIDWFWQRRDTVPTTPENEFRDRFELRVFESNRLFSDTSKPGWKTDMGKVHILVGPPDEINRDLMAKTHRGIVTWVYRRPPFPDLPPNTVIAFARDTSGELRLSTSPTLDSDVARGLQFARVKITADDRMLVGDRDYAYLDAGAPVSQSKLETMLVLGRVQQLPPAEEELFKGFVTTQEFYGAIPIESRADFYKSGDGSTYTTLTVGIRSRSVQYRAVGRQEVPDVQVFGKLINKEDPSQSYPLGSDAGFIESPDNSGAGPGDLLVFQAIGAFKPGRYQLVLGVQDRVSKRIGSYRQDVTVPDLSAGALALSSITLAGSMEPTEHLPATAKPFQLGKFKVVPRPDARFSKSDELNIYFQIYNPAVDPAAGQPRIHVAYTFRASAGDGTFKDLGTYEVKETGAQVQGYAVPLERWTPGEYQVAVTVRDLVAGTTAERTVEFIVRE
jgi:GWxTD domain-containing protein